MVATTHLGIFRFQLIKVHVIVVVLLKCPGLLLQCSVRNSDSQQVCVPGGHLIATVQNLQKVQFGSGALQFGFPGWLNGKESACNAGDVVRSQGQEGLLEDEMANCPSIFAWRIPWTEEPGELQSLG